MVEKKNWNGFLTLRPWKKQYFNEDVMLQNDTLDKHKAKWSTGKKSPFPFPRKVLVNFGVLSRT